ncbi:hypothetical protein MMC25_003643 [Agyrium rufum]|nr:hypothetical protein [Agyrium rufum]
MTASTEERPACPFCPFTVASFSDDHEMDFLMQHLELCHPENGQTPVIAVDGGRHSSPSFKDAHLSVRAGKESTPLRSELSEDEDEDEGYVKCPRGCGEIVTLAELVSHMELHASEEMSMDDEDRGIEVKQQWLPDYQASSRDKGHSPIRYQGDVSAEPSTTMPSSHSKHNSGHATSRRRMDDVTLKDIKDLLLRRSAKKAKTSHQRQHKPRQAGVRRLGKSELGPYAFEEQMPTTLRKQLEQGAKVTVSNQLSPSGKIIRVEKVANETAGILPVLAQLCGQDSHVSKVFLCHPKVTHVVKMAREGGFCGYRNIQMMVSYIQGAKSEGWEHFVGPIPSIFRLQDLIEEAWDKGFNSTGRIETGGIKGTRKYIGTPEAQALLLNLGIGCNANAFNQPKEDSAAHHDLLDAVMKYFLQGVSDPTQKVCPTGLPPIYFQHPGHSLTIVGLEVRKSGSMNLLVLDPMFRTAPLVQRLIGSRFRSVAPEKVLKAYRRGESYLKKYSSFEILKLRWQSEQVLRGWPDT